MNPFKTDDFKHFGCKEEDALRLAPLADEKEGRSFRSPYSRDRDRILFTRSFRSLSEKTQVYLTSEASPSKNEYPRTRLTHTLEVANISKTISRLLGLNCDLIEAIGYGHDVGHPPFGHAGEEQLNLFLNGMMPLPRYILDCINSKKLTQAEKEGKRNFGDFKHNFQSVRQLFFLFSYDNQTDGLNLTFQCLEGILKHTGLKSKLNPSNVCQYPEGTQEIFQKLIGNKQHSPILEAKVIALCDEIAQVCHDLNDAIKIGVVPLTKFLERGDVLAAIGYAENNGKNVDIKHDKTHDDTNNTIICSALVEYFAGSTYEKMKKILLAQPKGTRVKDFIDEFPDVPEPRKHFESLQEYKDNLVINNYSMNRMDNKGKYVIRKLIEEYIKDWFGKIENNFGIEGNHKVSPVDISTIVDLIRTDSQGTAFRKIDSQLVQQLKPYLILDADYTRAIADHIAMMTDVSAEKEMIALYGY